MADPLLLGLTLAILTIIPYTIHKIKSAYTEKEKRLDALLRELDDEDSEENDTSKPLFQNQSIKSSSFDQPTEESDDEEYGNEFESPSSQEKIITPGDLNQTPQEIFKNRRILDADFGWESGDDEWGELYDYISKPFQEDKSKKEDESTTVPQKLEETVPQKSEETEEFQTPILVGNAMSMSGLNFMIIFLNHSKKINPRLFLRIAKLFLNRKKSPLLNLHQKRR